MSSRLLENELTCKPLDTYNEILLFLDNPPSWRSLCKELTPHSKSLIRNIEINKHVTFSLEKPETFCHFDPDAENVKRHEEKELPKTLVCHDMANGYHDDSFIDGTGHYDAYTFYNWSGIDIFCYFSHHLITIPPLGWINVGHAHGVKVIGTVITEWAEGVVFWNKILDSEVEYQNFASALVTIAKTLKFDGWLLNVENKITKPAVLPKFVKYLHQTLHQELPNAVLLWYDSVTIDGKLNWQNGLNDKNMAFFDACDGIFTNYSWSEADVMSSATAAGDRLTDLYIGLDVWGRNFYGGGQFNLQGAVKIAHQHGCSMAIFAPAWTYEAIEHDKTDATAIVMAEVIEKFNKFVLRDRALWGTIWPYLNTRVPCQLPFQTSFCRGQGTKRRWYGEVLCPVPWYNLRHMQYQPNSAHGPHGYLLSTIEDILKVSRIGIYKDTKGIIRYRESFQMSRQDIHSVKSKEANSSSPSFQPKVDSILAINEMDEIQDQVAPDSESRRSDEDEERPKSLKRKMKNALKHLFTLKSRKTEGETDDNVENDEPGPSQGRSMVKMSVHLRLGQAADKTRYALACVSEEQECMELHQDDSFTGGTSLRINPSDIISPEHRMIRLFHCDFYCDDTLVACVVTKSLMGFAEQNLNIQLFMKKASGENLKVVLVGRSIPHQHRVNTNPSGVINLYPLNDPLDPEFRALRKYLLLNEPGFYMPVENSFGWIVRYYEIQVPGSRITSINCRTDFQQGPILLGHFGLCQRLPEVSINEID